MPTNPYFNSTADFEEQTLLEDLVQEVIEIFGIDFYYLPRTLVKLDKIYESDDVSKFESAYPIEMYVNDFAGFEGDGAFLSKFGWEIRDQLTLTVSRRRFEESVAPNIGFWRPRESDLIYYPQNKKVFEIVNVQNKPILYPMGELPTYVLTVQLFEYSSEKFDTGIADIDAINALSENILDYALMDENSNYLVDENGNYLVNENYDYAKIDPLADNDEFNKEDGDLIDWSTDNPFGRLEHES